MSYGRKRPVWVKRAAAAVVVVVVVVTMMVVVVTMIVVMTIAPGRRGGACSGARGSARGGASSGVHLGDGVADESELARAAGYDRADEEHEVSTAPTDEAAARVCRHHRRKDKRFVGVLRWWRSEWGLIGG